MIRQEIKMSKSAFKIVILLPSLSRVLNFSDVTQTDANHTFKVAEIKSITI
jgi:hypothetical protein